MKKVNIGIIGFGNIGSAVAEVLEKNKSVIAVHSGVAVFVKKICDTRKIKTSYALTSDPYKVINDPQIDIIIEAIGGEEPACSIILSALQNKKAVVTSNKEVMAKHLPELLEMAQKNGVPLLFEASVGGGIPILRSLQEDLVGNRIQEVYGIVNGTTNYILSRMTDEGMEFNAALDLARQKGYAEPNPKADIGGYDASYKAVLLAAVAFGAKVDWKNVSFSGIECVSHEDIQYAKEIGYKIKLLAAACLIEGELDVRVYPALVPASHPLSSVADNYNAIYVKADPVGNLMYYGQGAGKGPTASAIISDVVKAAKGLWGEKKAKLKKYKVLRLEQTASRYYLRLTALDNCGVLADISRAFAQHKVSIAAVMQKETVGKTATIVVLLHKACEANLTAALSAIKKLSVVKKIGNVIRII